MLDKPYQPTNAEKQFLHTYTAGAMLPLTQASITAALVFVGSFVVAYVVFDAVDPLKPSVVLAVIAWIGTWLTRQRLWINLASFERMTGIDINNDGIIGDAEQTPKRDPIVVRVDDVKNGHYKSNTHKFPDWLTDEQLTALSNGLINLHRPFSRREWTTRARVFSDDQYRELQRIFIKYGMLQNSKNGFELSDIGKATMKQFAPHLPSPTEDAEVVVE